MNVLRLVSGTLLLVYFASVNAQSTGSAAGSVLSAAQKGGTAVVESIDEDSAAEAGVAFANAVRPSGTSPLIAPSEGETLRNMGAHGGRLVLPELSEQGSAPQQNTPNQRELLQSEIVRFDGGNPDMQFAQSPPQNIDAAAFIDHIDDLKRQREEAEREAERMSRAHSSSPTGSATESSACSGAACQ